MTLSAVDMMDCLGVTSPRPARSVVKTNAIAARANKGIDADRVAEMLAPRGDCLHLGCGHPDREEQPQPHQQPAHDRHAHRYVPCHLAISGVGSGETQHPLEDGKVTISRAAGSLTFPSRFMLVAAMNPCPCGYHGDPKRECRCSPRLIETYRQRISGPLLDRIDLHIEVPQVEYRDLKGGATGEASSVIRARVEAAREIQKNRYAGFKGKVVSQTNSALPPKLFQQHCQIDKEGSSMLEQAMNEMHLSARAHDRILKVARTLADLAASETIQSNHVLEAIQFRSLDRRLRW